MLEECTVRSPENVPNRLSATIAAQRSAAQNGQYSAPMYSTSGLPPEVSGGPLTGCGVPVTPLPVPTASSVAAGTLVTSETTCASAAPVGPLLAPPDAAALGPVLTFTTTKATTTATAPAASSIRLRIRARRAAARCAAIFCCLVTPCLTLLALPIDPVRHRRTDAGGGHGRPAVVAACWPAACPPAGCPARCAAAASSCGIVLTGTLPR